MDIKASVSILIWLFHQYSVFFKENEYHSFEVNLQINMRAWLLLRIVIITYMNKELCYIMPNLIIVICACLNYLTDSVLIFDLLLTSSTLFHSHYYTCIGVTLHLCWNQSDCLNENKWNKFDSYHNILGMQCTMSAISSLNLT